MTRRMSGESATTSSSRQRANSASSEATRRRSPSRSAAFRSVSNTSSARNGFGR